MVSPNELDRIVLLAEQALDLSLPCALATIVAVSGSSYRFPGARLLVRADGETAGCISGGCLERDVIQKCRQVMAESRSRLVLYDTAEEEFGNFGLGCGGSIKVLIEPLSRHTPHLEWLKEIHSLENPAVLVTYCGGGLAGTDPGTLAILSHGDLRHCSELPPQLLGFLMQNACEVIQQGRTRTLLYSDARGDQASLFLFELALPRPALIVFGAGPEVVFLAGCANLLGYRVIVVDERPGVLARIRRSLPESVACCNHAPDVFFRQCKLRTAAACVIGTHNESYDGRALQAAIASGLGYIGLLGPKRRAARIAGTLLRNGGDANTIRTIYAPVGLDIGGDTPEQIALSVLAEIQAVAAHRQGGFLRERNAPIHAAEKVEAERAS